MARTTGGTPSTAKKTTPRKTTARKTTSETTTAAAVEPDPAPAATPPPLSTPPAALPPAPPAPPTPAEASTAEPLIAQTGSPVPVGQVIADPAPLGLAAFALTTFVLSLDNANIWASAGSAVSLAIAYGGVAQLLAGMWEFKRGNTFGATAFSSFGAFWISFYFLAFVVRESNPEAIGAYLLAWTIFTAYMTIASIRVSAAVFVVFALLTLTVLLLTIGGFNPASTGVSGWTEWGGWFGLATAAAAWYASFAGVTNETFKRVLIPTGSVLRD